MRELKESEWKLFRKVHREALERFCERILAGIHQIEANSSKSFHQRYLDIYKFIARRDREMEQAFNNPRRSTALIQLALMRELGLLGRDEFSEFSRETGATVARIVGSRKTDSP